MADRETIPGVNIQLGDGMSQALYEASKLTQTNRPGLVNTSVDSFSGFRAIDGDYLGDMHGHWLHIGLDGVGTKVEIAERTGRHERVAHDLFAMICDDAAVRGGEPLAVGSILDVRSLSNSPTHSEATRRLLSGYVSAAELAGVVIVNGELAELGGRVDGYVDEGGSEANRFNYNWGGVVLWDALKSRALDGKAIHEGDALVGFAEPGFRSNGMTDVRRVMLEVYGPQWHAQIVPELGHSALGDSVQSPSRIYCQTITALTGGRDPEREPQAKIHGVAHITGGGQPSKLGRMLEASGLDAIIDTPLEPPPIMAHVQELSGFDDRTAYGKWHMGPGMVVATSEAEKVVAQAQHDGHDAQIIGYVTDVPGIHVRNRGVHQEEEWLQF